MDGYQKFVEHHLSQLRRETKNDQLPKPECFQIGLGTSLIRFHGRPILPPLLSGKQREEMQRHKEAAQRAFDQRKSLTEARMARVNNILHTVKLRQAPTLEDFFQEKASLSEARTSGIISVSTCQSSDVNEVKGSVFFSIPSVLMPDEKESVCVAPFTSTAHSTLSTGPLLSPQVQNNQKVLCNEGQTDETYSSDLVSCSTGQYCTIVPSQPASDPLADVSHQSLSSGYVTYENAGNASCFSDQTESVDVRLRLDFEDITKNNSTVFLRNASNTIVNMPDIVSHPPIDGEELEASSIYKDTVSSAAEDIYDPSSWGGDIIANEPVGELVTSSPLCSDEALPYPIGGSECSQLGNTITYPSQMMYCSRQDTKTVVNVDPDPAFKSVKNISPSDRSESFKKVTSDGSSTTDQLPLQNQAVDWRQSTVVNADFEALEGPYRQSLQTLLKKSQEHRRRQKQLRNQAKNLRMQEQQQRRDVEEEHGFSDKENNELSLTGVTSTEGRKTMEEEEEEEEEEENKPRSVEVNKKNETGSPGPESPGLSIEEWTSTTPTGDDKLASKTWTGVEKDTWSGVEIDLAFKGITLHFSPEVPVESGVIVDHVSQPRHVLPPDDSIMPFYLAKEQITACGLPKTYYLGRGRFQNVPVPKFCMSPVRRTRIGKVHEEASDCDRSGAPKRKLLVNTALNVESEYCSEVALKERHQDGSVSPTVPLVAGSDGAAPLARSSQQAEQIALLEMNLSSLKALISDLESTLTEPPESQTLGSQPDRSHGPIDVHYLPTDHSTDSAHEDNHGCDQWEEMRQIVRDGSAVEGKQDNSEEQRRRFLDGYNTTLQSPEDKENRGGDGGEVTVPDDAAPGRVHRSDRGTASSQPALSTSRDPPQPSAKRPVTSRAQKMRVPDAFRKVLRKVSVLSDHSNRPMEREAETPAHEDDSYCHSLSLNQSYDVDTPSGLWPREDAASDFQSSKGGAPQGQQLTPEVEAGQGGASRAKRRLVMHAAEGSKAGRWPRGEGGDGAFVRPQASTPKASPQSSRDLSCQMDMHQQLKQTHAAQVKALQEEQRRQQLELLQTLAVRYHVLQSMSFPCPTSSSRLGDVSPSLPPSPSPPPPPPCSGSPPHTRLAHPVVSISQPCVSVAECCRPLVAAAVKGFLTRRVLRTERVGQLLRTIKDTQRFLQAFQPQTPGRGEFSSRQDMALQERVTLQLRSARYEFHDIFFSQSAGDRMQIISWDRELVRERQLKLQKGDPVQPKGRTSLSAATQKALDRRRGEMIQRKVVGRHRSLGPEAGRRVELVLEEPCEPKRGQFKANPRRVPKTTPSSRRTHKVNTTH